MSANSGPGYKQYPDHRIMTKPAGVRVEVDSITVTEAPEGSTKAA